MLPANELPTLRLRPALAALAAASLAGALAHAVGCPREAAAMAGIFTLAAGLWATEAAPLFATSLLVILLEVVLLANPGKWPGLGFEGGGGPTQLDVLRAAADPVLLLFFGGFLVARSLAKEGADRLLCARLMRPFGTAPRRVLLGFLVVNAFLSLWMSNTATAAITITLAAPLVRGLPTGDPLRKALYLAIPLGANLGGIGTPVASPPNAIALGYLRERGVEVSFGMWMLTAAPVLITLLLAAWWWLAREYPSRATAIAFPPVEPLTARGRVALGVFAGTALLWLTDSWHGLPPAAVALLASVILTASGLITREDLSRIEWSALVLIAGGVALGAGVQLTGADRLLAAALPAPAGPVALLTTIVLASMAAGMFLSNTAAVNLLLPFALAAGAAAGLPAAPVVLAVVFAEGGGLMLPGSTPPNAIAHASGEFTTRDLLRASAFVAVCATVIVVLVARVLVAWM